MKRSWLAMAALLAVTGCAAAPPAPSRLAQLAGTSWRVVAVNGQATPVRGEYAMRFDAGGGVGARFGCNGMGGQYRLAGDQVTVSNLTSTLMGCPEPAATLERQGAAVLGQPMRIAFGSNGRMSLTNSVGSIALDPMP
jgi:heat shock protein HslJ